MDKTKGRSQRLPSSEPLPESFKQRLIGQLGSEEFEAFAACQTQTPWGGLRFNTLKGSPEDLRRLLPFELEPVPWTTDGFYYPLGERPAKLPFYQAGLYYLQEPSAMSSAAMLDVRPGDRVLDLCAAPGGKSTQLAAALGGTGFLAANDNSPKRVKALVWNLEHWGTTNYIVLQEEPSRMTAAFSQFFDKILVDAPCSGEGMFRKDPKAITGWKAYNGEVCRKMQDEILEAAAPMLRPGGRMIYSTCTFNPLENEETIQAFLGTHTDFRLAALPVYPGWMPGKQLPETRQLWPHRVRGEGHFLALLEKSAASQQGPQACTPQWQQTVAAEALLKPFYRFMDENFTAPVEGPFAIYQQHVYKIYGQLPSLDGLKVAKPGWYMGMLKGERFEPSQALAMGIRAEQAKRRLDLLPDDPLVSRYLKGETLMVQGEPGWTLVTLSGHPLGFGKQMEDYLKNHYPPGWRQFD
ncbi:MAG TPA: SAM-dependent methyltransferase [Peptococcaceae bacterium]|nr:SAM-dependent methyltransferase [Peptococcaceae bacterium]